MQLGFTAPNIQHLIPRGEQLIPSSTAKLADRLKAETVLSGAKGDVFLRRYERLQAFQNWLQQRRWTLADFISWFAKAPEVSERIH